MKRSFFLGAIGGFVALTLSSGVFATTLWLKCQHCVSTNAQQFAEQSTLIGTVMVYSLNNRFHAKFENQLQVIDAGCHTNGNVGRGKLGTNSSPQGQQSAQSPQGQQSGNCSNVLIATPDTPDAEENELMRILQLLSDNTGGTMKIVVPMTGWDIGEPGGSAHEYPNNAEFAMRTRNEVWRLLNDPTRAFHFLVNGLDGNAFVIMMNIIRGGAQVALGGDFNLITVVVTYLDGSKVTLKYDGDRTLISEVTQSAEGRVIMTRENIQIFTLEPLHMNNDRSVQEFLENAQRLGIRIRNVGSGSRIVRCSTEVEIGTNNVITTCTDG